MSYSIIFQTLMVEKNGKIYWFNRSGCNNDDFGRKAEDFTLKIYDNKESALKDIERFKGYYEYNLKLSGKMVSYDYYYNYLKKKIEKPLSYEKFKSDYCSGFSQLKSIEYFEMVINEGLFDTRNFDFYKCIQYAQYEYYYRKIYEDLEEIINILVIDYLLENEKLLEKIEDIEEFLENIDKDHNNRLEDIKYYILEELEALEE